MNKQGHDTIHSLVPVYAALSRIKKLSVDGWNNNNPMLLTNAQLSLIFQDIQRESDDGMAQLMMVEKDLASSKHKRRKYEK